MLLGYSETPSKSASLAVFLTALLFAHITRPPTLAWAMNARRTPAILCTPSKHPCSMKYASAKLAIVGYAKTSMSYSLISELRKTFHPSFNTRTSALQ